MTAPSHIELLEADIDLRLHTLWEDVPEDDRVLICALMRASYALGYKDALTEPQVWSLANDHGYRALPRRADV